MKSRTNNEAIKCHYLLALILAAKAFGYGGERHQLVALIAEERLTADAQIAEILNKAFKK